MIVFVIFIFLMVTGIPIIMLNIIEIAVIVWTSKKKGIQKSQIYLLSLSISDFLVGIGVVGYGCLLQWPITDPEYQPTVWGRRGGLSNAALSEKQNHLEMFFYLLTFRISLLLSVLNLIALTT